jgi:hypothetical protein
MATIKPRTNKYGSIISYEIRVSLGRDIHGKQIFKYMSWTPEPAMKPKQIEKELERQKVLFEERCRSGKVLDTSTKFADFAEMWLEGNKDIHSLAYQNRACALLARINAAIGHIQLAKLQPHHLQEFYRNLAEAGIKKRPDRPQSLPRWPKCSKTRSSRARCSLKPPASRQAP